MKKIILLFFLLLPLVGLCQEAMTPVVIDGDEVSYLTKEGKVIAKGNVKMAYKEVELYCQEAKFDANTNIADIVGDVKIVRGQTVLYGKDIIYDFNTYNAKAKNIRIQDPPIYGVTEKGSKIGKEKYILEDGYVTTCDLTEPHYRLVSKHITVYPEEKVVGRNMILKIGKVPVFYLPYVSQSLKDESFIMNVVPGDDKEWGTFVLTRWRYTASLRNRGNIFTDWYDRRGLGLGVTHKSTNDKIGHALLKYYRIEDYLYKQEERYALFSQHPSRQGIPAKRLEDDRYKAQFSYEWDSPELPLSIKAEFHKFSDVNFMKDFFELEYETDPSPLSYILTKYSFAGSSFSLLMQKRVNRFFSDVEYLPQLEHNFYSQVLGLSRFYLQSDNKIGNLNNTSANSGEGSDAFRIHSHNVLDHVNNIKWLNVNPFVGYYTTFYSRNGTGQDNILRLVPEFGVNLSTKLYKYIRPKNLNILGEEIDLMRHIVTPELEYKYIREPIYSRSRSTFSFDNEDSVSRTNDIVFTLKNKWQAKNSQRTWDFIYFSPAVTYQIDPEGNESRFTSITTNFEIYPKKGVSLTSDLSYSIDTKRITGFNTDLSYEKKMKVMEAGEEVEKTKYLFVYGHRYSRQSSTQGTMDFTYQLTPKLQVKTYTLYEYNTEDFRDQQYKIRTDLHCWWMDLGVRLNRRSEGSKDFTIWVEFTLKAFPDISFSIDQSREGAKKSYR